MESIKLLHELLVISSAFEPPGPLVVHFGAGSNSVEGHDDHFLGLEDVDNHVNVVEDLQPDLLKLFGQDLRLEND